MAVSQLCHTQCRFWGVDCNCRLSFMLMNSFQVKALFCWTDLDVLELFCEGNMWLDSMSLEKVHNLRYTQKWFLSQTFPQMLTLRNRLCFFLFPCISRMIWRTALCYTQLWLVLSLVSGDLTSNEKTQIVDLLNRFRSSVNPGAANMQRMVSTIMFLHQHLLRMLAICCMEDFGVKLYSQEFRSNNIWSIPFCRKLNELIIDGEQANQSKEECKITCQSFPLLVLASVSYPSCRCPNICICFGWNKLE